MKSLEASPISLKPVLKWAGGKRWLVPVLREMWQPHSHRRLVEPFVGGMAVTRLSSAGAIATGGRERSSD